MPRPRPPFLHKEITRHGTTVWYVRVDRGPRIRIRETFGTPQFRAAYEAAIRGEPSPASLARKPGFGTIAWAANLYKHSSAWSRLSPATRRQRDNILEKIVKSAAGGEKLASITRETIVKGRERRKDTPAAARHFVDTMRGLFKWAIDEAIVTIDPTAGVVAKAAKTDGHKPWTEEDVAAYQAAWAIGTRERVAFDLLLFTGLRRGDVVAVGRPHVRDGMIRFKTEKTGEWVYVSLAEELQRTLDAGPCGDLTFIVGERGRPRVKESFGEWFRGACHAAGIKKSAHGIRKLAATRDANDGWSETELEAKYGWRGGRMASHYTRSADRERVSLAAAKRSAESKSRTCIPAPGEKVRAAGQIDQ